jgi:outer membrane protein assembly factor BamB
MRRSLAWAGGLVLGLVLVHVAGPVHALIQRLYPLAAVIRESQYVFMAKVEKVDPDRPAVVLTADEDLKGKAPFGRLAVNLKGDKDSDKLGHTPQLLKRLAPNLPVVVFAYPSGKRYLAFGYTNGTWLQMEGVKADDSDTYRWRYNHCEPYLRRTYKESTAELKQVIVDALAGKKQPPEPDSKAEPGFGPEVKPGDAAKPGGDREVRAAGGPVFAVIPTVLIGGPLAILALMFPAVFGGLTLFFRRWLVVLSVISLASTLYVLHGWLSPWIHDAWYGTPLALWVAMTLLGVAGLLWSWRRHARALAQEAGGSEPGAAGALRRNERIALWVVSLLGVAVVGGCLLWRAPLLDDSWRKAALVLWVGVWAGTLSTLLPRGAAALPAEGAMLGGMVAAGLVLGFPTLPRAAAAPTAETVTTGGQADAEGARRVGMVWKFEAPSAGWIASSPLVAGDRVYVAAAHGGVFEKYGTVYCLDRATGKELWHFPDDRKMKQVFSTPCLAGGRLYVGEGFHEDTGCNLYCLDAATGTKLWVYATNSHTESSPCVAGGKVYCGAGDDGLLCLNAGTGKEVWHYPGLHVDCNPVVVGNRVYAGSGVGDVYRETCLFCLDADTGEQVWRVPTDQPVWGGADGRRPPAVRRAGQRQLRAERRQPRRGGRLLRGRDRQAGLALQRARRRPRPACRGPASRLLRLARPSLLLPRPPGRPRALEGGPRQPRGDRAGAGALRRCGGRHECLRPRQRRPGLLPRPGNRGRGLDVRRRRRDEGQTEAVLLAGRHRQRRAPAALLRRRHREPAGHDGPAVLQRGPPGRPVANDDGPPHLRADPTG